MSGSSRSIVLSAVFVAGAALVAAGLVEDPAWLRPAAMAVGLAVLAWLARDLLAARAAPAVAFQPPPPPDDDLLRADPVISTAPEPEPEPEPADPPPAPPARSEGPFRQLFQSGPVSVALLAGDGAVKEYSGAFADLLQADHTLIGQPFQALFDDKDREAIAAAVEAAVAGEASHPIVARLAHGPKPTCEAILVRVQDDPVVIAASVKDVTQEKKLEAQFAQSQKMLAVGQLAGGVAHDFNNLLTAIIGHADLLMLRHNPSDDSFADINQIKQNANRAANLTRQLLAFSRQQTLQPQVLDIGEALSDLGNLLRRLLGAGVALHIRHGRDVGLIKVDRVQLEQVVINLAVNARDAMDGKGALDISTRMETVGDTAGTRLEPMPAGEYVRIDVADTGAGIKPEDIGRIFEPFFTTKPLGEGTGLGLSTVYGIMKQTGGFIFVDSAVGKGTTFSLYLPPHAETASEAKAKADEKTRDLTGAGTIMLVEDEDPVRLFGARALRGKGYRVIEASTGEAALKLFQEGEADDVDLLVTDIVMPELDGPSLIAAARTFRPDLPVVCVSGYAESAFREKLAGLGDVHFLPKPFTLNQLAGKVKDVIP